MTPDATSLARRLRRRYARRRHAPLPLLAFGGVAIVVSFLPLAYLVIRATGDGWGTFRDVLVRQRTLDLTIRSLELAVSVTAACLLLSLGLAWLVTRTDLPGRRVVQVVVGLPLALPSYVAAFSWISLRPDLAGFRGAFIVLVSISYPYVYLPVVAALRRTDPGLEDAARTLGHGRAAVFWRVVLPQLRASAAGGCLLVGLYVLSDFGAVATMRHEVLTHVVYRSYRASFDRTPAAVLGCLIAVLTLLIVVIEARTRGRRDHARSGAGTPRAQPVVQLGWLRWPALLVPLAVVALSLGVPAWGMRRWSSRGSSRADAGELWEAGRHTLQVGAYGALAVMLLAVPVAYLSVRHPGWWSRLSVRAAYMGHALPGVVVGLGMVFFGIRFATPWYQRLPLLVFAYVVLFLSLGIAAVQGAISQVPVVLEDVARTLGRSAFGAWRSVTLRLMLPGIGAAAALVCVTVMKELPATLFLRPTGWDTLATRLWSHTSSQSYAAAAPYGVAIVVLAAVPTALLATLGERREKRRQSS